MEPFWNGYTLHILGTMASAQELLLVRGADSWAMDPEAQGRLAALPAGSQVTIPNAAHWVHHDNFDAFVRAIDGFLG